MDRRTANELSEILAQQGTPCLSLYQPIYRSPPETGQNRVRFENLCKRLWAEVKDRHGKRSADEAIAPLEQLAKEPGFLKPISDGLAVFSSPGYLRVLRLPRSVSEHAEADDSFHVKPLIRILQTNDRFHVLAISEQEAKLFEGNRDSLVELDGADGVPRTIFEALPEEFTDPDAPEGVALESKRAFGGPVVHMAPRSRVDAQDADIARFWRVVDRAVLDRYSQPSTLPLILAALPQHQTAFRHESRNPNLLAVGLELNPMLLGADELRKKAWELMEPRYRKGLQQLVEEFNTAKANGRASDDLQQLGEAAAMSRIRVLMLDGKQHRRGCVDAQTGAVELSDEEDDVYDNLAEFVLRRGGEVLVLEREYMPSSSPVAAIYRF